MKFLITILAAAALAPSVAAQPAVDLVLVNGRVFTSDPLNPWAEAVAIAGNSIAAVGTNENIAKLIGPGAKRIDLRGRLVIPGVNDAHTDETPWPETFILTISIHSTADEIILALISAADETPAVTWLTGTTSRQALTDPALTAASIEKAAPGRKVALFSDAGDLCVLSDSALDALKLRRDAASVPGFERDARGSITGRAFGYAAVAVARKIADSVSDEDAVATLRDFASTALRYGVTSVQNVSRFPMVRFEKSVRHADVLLRIRMMRAPVGDADDGGNLPSHDRDRELSVLSGTVRILDSADASGKSDVPGQNLSRILQESLATNDQTVFCAATPNSVSALFESMNAVPAVDWSSKRIRLENAGGLTPPLIRLAKTLGVVVVAKPEPTAPLMALQRAGVHWALRSIGPFNPYQTIAILIAGGMTREEAVQAYTRGGAFAEFAENEKGTIAAGKLADLAVLSQDIFKVPADEIANTESELTIVNGKIAYDAGTLDVPGRPKRRMPAVE